MFCWKCGSKLYPDAKFCVNCGMRIQKEEPGKPEEPREAEPVREVCEQAPEQNEEKKPRKGVFLACMAVAVLLFLTGVSGAFYFAGESAAAGGESWEQENAD